MDKLSRFSATLDELDGTDMEELTYIVEGSDSGVREDIVVRYDENEDDDEDTELEYNSDFGPAKTNMQTGHDERVKEHQYNEIMGSQGPDELEEHPDKKPGTVLESEDSEFDANLLLSVRTGRVEYRSPKGNYDGMEKGPDAMARRSGLLSIEYDRPELINGQRTYQRIVFEAESDGETVYEATMRKFVQAGMESSAARDSDFGTMIFTSLNNKREGTGGNFNEFYLNGEIGENAVDKQQLKKGDIVEWRYAEESDGTCGGVPDFQRIKSALQQYTISAGAVTGYDAPQEQRFLSPFPNQRLSGNYNMLAGI